MILSFAPSSRMRPHFNVTVRDVLFAILIPPFSFWLRDPSFLTNDKFDITITYTAISFIWSIGMTITLQLNRTITRYFSLPEARQILLLSASVVAGTTITSFILSRLDSVPRSFPVLHFMVMVLVHVLLRAWSHQRYYQRRRRNPLATSNAHPDRNILVVGCNRLAWFYIRILDTFML